MKHLHGKKTYFQSGDSWLRRRVLTFSPRQPSIASLDQKPHKKTLNKSTHGVEMNPNLYCVSLGDSWAFETYSHTCSLVQLLLTEPSLSLSNSPPPSLSLPLSLFVSYSPSLSPPCTYRPCSSDIPISGHPMQPRTPSPHTHTQTYSHAHTSHSFPPVPSRPWVQTAGLTASDKCSWICCCPSPWTGFQQSSMLLPGSSLSSARHPARTKQGHARSVAGIEEWYGGHKKKL